MELLMWVKLFMGTTVCRTGAKYNTYTISQPEEKANEYIVKSSYTLWDVLTTVYAIVTAPTQARVQRCTGSTTDG